jgi:hypothetical protein
MSWNCSRHERRRHSTCTRSPRGSRASGRPSGSVQTDVRPHGARRTARCPHASAMVGSEGDRLRDGGDVHLGLYEEQASICRRRGSTDPSPTFSAACRSGRAQDQALGPVLASLPADRAGSRLGGVGLSHAHRLRRRSFTCTVFQPRRGRVASRRSFATPRVRAGEPAARAVRRGARAARPRPTVRRARGRA